ncbi:MAG: DUF6154 family protein [Calditerricola sp.]|jgi:hypothetical protein|nr:cytosolic protein [Bacillota bacterium]MCG0315149.1 DUF6154 family protein [Calditerricola sp.]
MRFLEDLYAFYREQMAASEEDTMILLVSILQEHNREDLLRIIGEMSEAEMRDMLALYLFERIQQKMAREAGQVGPARQATRMH